MNLDPRVVLLIVFGIVVVAGIASDTYIKTHSCECR